MNKLVSVIIPVYNEEKVIADCLKSLTKQTYKPLEIIIIDDGSTDKTLQVLSEFRIARLERVSSRKANFEFRISHQHHSGPGSARNLITDCP